VNSLFDSNYFFIPYLFLVTILLSAAFFVLRKVFF
jgi:hypothetical protein